MRLGDLVMPLNDKGEPDPTARVPAQRRLDDLSRAGLPADRHQVRRQREARPGRRRGRGQAKTEDLIPAPYRADWSGEFEEMEQAERPADLDRALVAGLIFIFLYVAFRNFLDTFVVFGNVLAWRWAASGPCS